jgi:hypothetical protein
MLLLCGSFKLHQYRPEKAMEQVGVSRHIVGRTKLMPEGIEITSEVDGRNSKICRFTTARTLYIGAKTVSNANEATGLPLAEKLICIDGVTKLQLIGHLLVVTKTLDKEWRELAKQIEAVLTACLVSGLALTSEEVYDRMMLMGRSIREKLQYLITWLSSPPAPGNYFCFTLEPEGSANDTWFLLRPPRG